MASFTSTLQKIDELLLLIQSQAVTSKNVYNCRKIKLTASINTNRINTKHLIIKNPIYSQYPWLSLLKKLRKAFNINIKIRKIFISSTGKEINRQNIQSIFQNIHRIDILISFGEKYIQNPIINNIYHNLYDGKTYPFINNTIRQKITCIQKQQRFQGYYQSVMNIYNLLKESNINNNDYNNKLAKRIGLKCDYISNQNLINATITEINHIFWKLIVLKPQLNNVADGNLQFYINNPFFTRRNDSWPMFKWNDKNVANICKCIKIVSNKLLNKDITINTVKLQIIVRQYKYGDFLGFHNDGGIFGETICGIVLRNNYPQNGLMFYHNKLKQYMLNENIDGLCWSMSDCSRWQYDHGLYIPFKHDIKDIQNIANYGDDFARISVSFRWFNNLKDIPKYHKQNDVK